MKFGCFSLLILFSSCVMPCVGQITNTDSSKVTPSHESGNKNNVFVKKNIFPVALIGVGTYLTLDDHVVSRFKIRDERNRRIPSFHTGIDNYILHAPIVAVYGLNALGVKGKNDFRNRSLLLVKSEVIMFVLTFSTKELAEVTRPDNSDNKSFPSGHTSHAFAVATFMAKEYGDKSIWYTVGAYGVATSVGVLRIMNNKHWISDVLTGAGIGILSTNIAYATHRYRWTNKNKNQLTVMPTYSKGLGVYLCYQLR